MNKLEQINLLFQSLGKSEKNQDIKDLLRNLNVPQPLPRADRFTDDLLLEKVTPYLNLGFSTYDELELTHTDDSFMEGELVFAELSIKRHKDLKDVLLPLDMVFNVNLDFAVRKLGDFSDKTSFENTYEWKQDGFSALFSFDENNENMYEACYLLLPTE